MNATFSSSAPAPASDFGLRQRVVVITDVAHGRGAACARRRAHSGAQVALRNTHLPGAHALASTLRDHRAQAQAVLTDEASHAMTGESAHVAGWPHGRMALNYTAGV